MAAPKYPKLTFSDICLSDQFYCDREGDQYSVTRLIDESKDLTPFELPLAGIDMSGIIWADSTAFDLASHVKQCMDADLSFPIILDWHGAIADGRHRVIRAISEGKTTIKAVRITWKMTPCRVSEND